MSSMTTGSVTGTGVGALASNASSSALFDHGFQSWSAVAGGLPVERIRVTDSNASVKPGYPRAVRPSAGAAPWCGQDRAT